MKLSLLAYIAILFTLGCTSAPVSESARAPSSDSERKFQLNSMKITEIKFKDEFETAASLTLAGQAGAKWKKAIFRCEGTKPTELEVTPVDGAVELYKAKDFYIYGCHGLMRALTASGLKEGSDVYTYFWGENAFPGFMIYDKGHQVGFTFIPSGRFDGVFKKEAP